MAPKNYFLKFALGNRSIFEFIKSGAKKVETRAASVKYKGIKIGDTVTLSCGKQKFIKKIKRATVFDSIDSLLDMYEPSDINPDLKSRDEIEEMYMSFPGYEEKIKEFGIIALELED